jgi:hypothetical protein
VASDAAVDLGPWREVPRDPIAEILEAHGEEGLRYYQREVVDGWLTLMVARAARPGWERPLWHLSLSHKRATKGGKTRPGRYPRWDEVSEARYRFVPDEARMAMILPPKGEYVNEMSTCFHLWEVDAPEAGSDGG